MESVWIHRRTRNHVPPHQKNMKRGIPVTCTRLRNRRQRPRPAHKGKKGGNLHEQAKNVSLVESNMELETQNLRSRVAQLESELTEKEKDVFTAAELGKKLLDSNQELQSQLEENTKEYSQRIEVLEPVLAVYHEVYGVKWLIK